jgi:hypothetical protein
MLFVSSVFCLLSLAAPVHADPAADAKVILDDALKAMGGADKLAKLPATTFKSKGTLFANSMKFDYSDNWELQAPDKFRWNLTLRVNERDVPVAFVLTGKDAFTLGGDGKARDLPDENSHMLKVDCRCALLAHWLPALREKGTGLTPLGELKINDRAAVGLKVSRKGSPDVDLFFDKETKLPVKMETRFKETKDGPDVAHIFTFAEYKEADGLKYFSRVKLYRDETQLLDMEVMELKRLDKIDDGRFAKP